MLKQTDIYAITPMLAGKHTHMNVHIQQALPLK